MESKIEREFARWVKSQGGYCLKQNANWYAGVPDRLVILPGGRCFFVEFKSDIGPIRPIQKKRKRELRSRGVPAYYCRTLARAKRLYQRHVIRS